jgi:hypothetical protein
MKRTKDYFLVFGLMQYSQPIKFLELFLVLLLIVGSANTSFTQSRNDVEKDWSLFKNNKVKAKICTNENGKDITYFDIDGKPLKKESFDNSGFKIADLIFVYDKNTQLTREDNFFKSGEKSTTNYDYDVNGNIISIKSDGFTEDINYDTDNKISEITFTEIEEGGAYYTAKYYYVEGVVSKIEYSCDDGYEITEEYKYYDNGNMDKVLYYEKQCDAKNQNLFKTVQYYYTSKNNLLIKTETILNNNKFIENYNYEYYE